MGMHFHRRTHCGLFPEITASIALRKETNLFFNLEGHVSDT